MRIVSAMVLLAGLLAAFADEPRSKPAPDFTLKDLNGLEVSSTNFAGKTRLVCFWVSTDKPCQRQLPALVELQNDYGTSGVTVIGMALEKNSDALKGFAETNSINFPILFPDYDLIRAFGGLEAIPTTYVVEPHGYIVKRYVGVKSKNELKEFLDAVLRSPQ